MPTEYEEPIAVTYSTERGTKRAGFKDMRVQVTPLKNGRVLLQWFDAPTYMRAFFAGSVNHVAPIGLVLFVDGVPFKALPFGRNDFAYANLTPGERSLEIRLAYPPGPGSVPRYSLPLEPIDNLIVPAPNAVNTVTIAKNEDHTLNVSFNNTMPEKDKYIITVKEDDVPIVTKTIEEKGTSHIVVLVPPFMTPEKEYKAEVKVGEQVPVVSPTPVVVDQPTTPNSNFSKWYVYHHAFAVNWEEEFADFDPNWAVVPIHVHQSVGVEKFQITTYATEERWMPTWEDEPVDKKAVYVYEGPSKTVNNSNENVYAPDTYIHYVRIPKYADRPWQVVYVTPFVAGVAAPFDLPALFGRGEVLFPDDLPNMFTLAITWPANWPVYSGQLQE